MTVTYTGANSPSSTNHQNLGHSVRTAQSAAQSRCAWLCGTELPARALLAGTPWIQKHKGSLKLGDRVRDGLGWGWRQGRPKLDSLSWLSTSTRLLRGPKHKFPGGNTCFCPIRARAISSSHGGAGSAAAVAEVPAGSTAAS